MVKGEEKIFKDFKGDLKFGEERERAFLAHFPGMTKGDGRKHDLYLPNGEAVELKSERYCILPVKGAKSTENLAVELMGDGNKPVGPFKARQEGVKWYVHWFLCGSCFIFNTEDFCRYLEEDNVLWVADQRTFRCPNIRGTSEWSAIGKALPLLSLVEHGIVHSRKLLIPGQVYENLF